MKCPVCESENSEGKKYCGECGGELPQPEQVPEEQPTAAVSTDPKAEAKRRKWLIPVLAIVVALAVVGGMFAILAFDSPPPIDTSYSNIQVTEYDYFYLVSVVRKVVL